MVGLTISECLKIPPFSRFEVLTGEAGKRNVFSKVAVLEALDGIYWVGKESIVFSCGYAFKDNKGLLVELIPEMAARNVAAFCIKVNRFLFSLPDGLVEKGREHGVPILIMPSDLSYDDVINPLIQELAYEQFLRQGSSFVQKCLEKIPLDNNIGELIETLSDYLRLPVLLFDRENALICFKTPKDVPWELGDSLAAVQSKLVGDYAAFSIPNNGQLLVLKSEEYFSDRLILLIRDFINIINVVLVYEEQKKSVSENEYLRTLINGEIPTEEELFRKRLLYNLDYSQSYFCVVAAIDDFIEGANIQQYAELLPVYKLLTSRLSQIDVLRELFAKIVVNTHNIAILIPARNIQKKEILNIASLVVDECRRNLGYSVSLGIGSTAATLLKSRISYREALKALTVGVKILGRNTIIHFDNLGSYGVLSEMQNVSQVAPPLSTCHQYTPQLRRGE